MPQVLCHCATCHKTSGSTNTISILVPNDAFTITRGSPKSYVHKHESGMTLELFFCGKCGSTIWKTAEAPPLMGHTIIEVGTLDGEALDKLKPKREINTAWRASWLGPLGGIPQSREVEGAS